MADHAGPPRSSLRPAGRVFAKRRHDRPQRAFERLIVVPTVPVAATVSPAVSALREVSCLAVADDDLRLYEHATQGDAGALEQLLQHYLPQLHAFVHVRLGSLRAREASLDVVQSVCRELLAERDTFAFRGEDRFRSWLFTAALNKLRERHRRQRAGKRDMARDSAAPVDQSFAAIAHLLTPSQDAIGNETTVAVAAALAELSEEHREVITLARLVRLPHKVIAETMGRSEEAARQLLARAMLQFARGLRARGVEVDAWRERR